MIKKRILTNVSRLIFLVVALVNFGIIPFGKAEADGESFTIHLRNYFVELQGGQRVDLDIHYQYAPNIAREDIPDYRAVQILVEDALYGMPAAGPYWEITNKEIVRRLLTAFPQFLRVESQFEIHPRAILNISRGSTVALRQAELAGAKLLTALDQDAYYQARPGHYNILVPRPLKASLIGLMRKVKKSAENAKDPAGVIFDLPCFPLAGSEFTFPALLAGLKPAGPYSAIVLPEPVGLKRGLVKLADAGPMTGFVRINNSTETAGRPVAEASLAELLGLENFDRLPLADARERFFIGQASAIVMEEKYAKPYVLRGDRLLPYESRVRLAFFAAPAADAEPVPEIIRDAAR